MEQDKSTLNSSIYNMGSESVDDTPQEKGLFNTRDHTTLYYEVFGKGKPLILCYGLLCRREHWRHQIKYFAKNYRVITFDYRGHQSSGYPPNDQHMTLGWCARDIEDLMSHLKIEKAVLLGHSMGVPVLVNFAEMAKERIEAMAFICGTVTNPFKEMFYTNRLNQVFHLTSKIHDVAPYVMDLIWKKMSEKNRFNYLLTSRLGFNATKSEEQDVFNYLEGVNRTPFAIFNSLMKDYTQFDGKRILPGIHSPVLVIAGGEDMITPAAQQEEIAELLPKGELLVIPEGSHNAHTDFPVRVNEAITDFLRKIGY